MRYWRPELSLCLFLGAAWGCPGLTIERNPFLGFTEEYGVAGQQQTAEGRAPGAVGTEEAFRKPLTIAFVNTCRGAVLKTSWVAWVELSSVRSGEQQDALLRKGYVQLTREVELGTAYTLPVGTFVFDGPGTAGATPVTLPSAQTAGSEQQEGGAGQGLTPTSVSFELITPDRVLMFSQPPMSCDSVAFMFIGPLGSAATGPVTSIGGFKTLAQVNVYECEPLRPGLFLKLGGGGRQANEFFEGENIRFEFNEKPDANGNFAIVTVSQG